MGAQSSGSTANHQITAVRKPSGSHRGLSPDHAAISPGHHGTALYQPGRPLNSETLVALQSAVGNATVSRSVESLTIQRETGVGGKDPGSVNADALYRRIDTILTDHYPKSTTDPALRERLLQDLDALATAWMNTKGRSTDKADVARRTRIVKLLDDIPIERRELSQQAAQSTYLRDLTGPQAGPGGFTKLTAGARTELKTKIKDGAVAGRSADFVKKHRLSTAEAAAIITYSAADYQYINPSVANNSAWLESQIGAGTPAPAKSWGKAMVGSIRKKLGMANKKTVKPTSATSLTGTSKTAVEEGSLHAAMALKGLDKLPPVPESVYRGTRITSQAFQKDFQVGKILTFAALASSSANKNVAANFAHGLGGDSLPKVEQDTAVLTVIHDSGGRDISELSMFPAESEVLIMPGASFKTQSIKEIKEPAKEFPSQFALLKNLQAPLPKQWFFVTMQPDRNRKGH